MLFKRQAILLDLPAFLEPEGMNYCPLGNRCCFEAKHFTGRKRFERQHTYECQRKAHGP